MAAFDSERLVSVASFRVKDEGKGGGLLHVHDSVWRYLPGTQLRRVMLSKRSLALCKYSDSGGVREQTDLISDDSLKVLDTIPLHEISEVCRGDDDIERLFERLDAFQAGTLHLRELHKGMSRYGFTYAQTNALFATPLASGKERSAARSQEEEDLDALLEIHENEALFLNATSKPKQIQDVQDSDQETVDSDKLISREEFRKYLPTIRQSAAQVMVLRTIEGGYNSGMPYFLGHQLMHGEVSRAVQELQELVRAAQEAHRISVAWAALQARLSHAYNSELVQYFVAVVIFMNFLVSAFSLQVQPEPGTRLHDDLEIVDLVFTLFFLAELVVNMLAHWFYKFWGDGWNVFDFVVVLAGLIALLLPDLPGGLRSIRLVRAFRVLRVFQRLRSLRMLVNALCSAILPVGNAACIVLVVLIIYAVMGVSFFRIKDPNNFGTFFRAIYTMFQTWPHGMSWAVMQNHLTEDGRPDLGIFLFFTSFLLIISFILLPCVIAVLLDNFSMEIRQEGERNVESDRKKLEAEKQLELSCVSTDPMIKDLLCTSNSQDLSKQITTLFNKIDTDQSGHLQYNELVMGLKKMQYSPPVILSETDFDKITMNRTLCNEHLQISLENWIKIIHFQIASYCLRTLAVSVPAVMKGDIHTGILMLAVKLMLERSSATDGLPGHKSSNGQEAKELGEGAGQPTAPSLRDSQGESKILAMLEKISGTLEALQARVAAVEGVLNAQAQTARDFADLPGQPLAN